MAWGPLQLDIEGDVVTHSGEASARLPCAGTSPGRNQLGEVWPEEWTLAKDRSYGITARLGGPVPLFGADLSAFVGVRRLDATFRTSYTGCPLPTACSPGEFTDGRERHDEEYDAWVAGVAFEKSRGPVGPRGEPRYTDHGSSARTVRFDDVAVTVPVELEERGDRPRREPRLASLTGRTQRPNRVNGSCGALSVAGSPPPS